MSDVDKVIQRIKQSSNKTTHYYLNGGCYKFAKILQYYIGGDIMYLLQEEHCVLKVGDKLYDATGNVTNKYKCSKMIDESVMVSRNKIVESLDT